MNNKVWIVVFHDSCGDSYNKAVFSSKEKAEANAKYYEDFQYESCSVEEWNVDEFNEKRVTEVQMRIDDLKTELRELESILKQLES